MTPIDLFKVYQALMSEVNVQQGGQIRPVSDFMRWYNAISLELYREKVADAGINQQNNDDLAPFLEHINIVVQTVNGQYGLIPYPADYDAFSNLKVLRPKDGTTCGCNNKYPILDKGKCVQIQDPDYAEMEQKFSASNLAEFTINTVDNQQWANCLSHDTKGPTFEQPKATQYSNGFQIAPAGISIVVLDYFRTPREAVFAYTIDPTTDTIIYDPTNSIQLEWSSILENEFLTRLGKKYGLHVRDSETFQMANENKKQLIPG